MLARYKMYRGPRPAGDPLPDGIRQDTRTHTRHPLRPEADIVADYLQAPSESGWKRLRMAYRRALDDRFACDRSPFDALAALAAVEDVYLGCSCPTTRNPDPLKCHTVVALEWMKERYPRLTVRLPS